MLPLVIVAALGGLGVYLLTKPKQAAGPASDAETFGFVAIPIPETTPAPATDAERKALAKFDRVIAFVQRPGRPKLAANLAVDRVEGGAVYGSYISPFAYGKGWTASEPLPKVGETFVHPLSFVYYVYGKGEKVTTTDFVPAPAVAVPSTAAEATI